jgi:hypothetical protein
MQILLILEVDSNSKIPIILTQISNNWMKYLDMNGSPKVLGS